MDVDDDGLVAAAHDTCGGGGGGGGGVGRRAWTTMVIAGGAATALRARRQASLKCHDVGWTLARPTESSAAPTCRRWSCRANAVTASDAEVEAVHRSLRREVEGHRVVFPMRMWSLNSVPWPSLR